MEQPKLTKKERRELKKQKKRLEQEKQAKRKSIRYVLIWVLIAIGASMAAFGLAKLTSRAPADNSPVASGVDFVVGSDWVKGNRESSVTLIEYSDFQCPACGFYQPLLKELSDEFGDKIGFVYRHFPLRSHQNAKIAAQAAEAAGRQGKFWPMHDLIFENQKEWSDKGKGKAKEIFVSYAKSLELNEEQFGSDFELKEIKKKIDDSYSGGLRAGVDSTPSFFLNGEKIKNPQTYEEFKELINEALGDEVIEEEIKDEGVGDNF